jgi:hypothetical protein
MEVPTAEELAKSQADLNEYVAYIIMGEAFNELRYVYRSTVSKSFTALMYCIKVRRCGVSLLYCTALVLYGAEP